MTSDALAVSESVVRPGLSRDQIELLKRTIAKGASDDELALFVQICNRTQLDPFARQIYAIQRWDSNEGRTIMQTQTSIDGLRLIAERTGNYEGQTETLFSGRDAVWTSCWVSDEPPLLARIGVYRKGFREPLYAVARWGAYVQTKKDGTVTSMWAKMPDLMLSKCAEALALRKAFPNDLSGLYTSDELGAVSESAPPAPTPAAPAAPSAPAEPTQEDDQRGALMAAIQARADVLKLSKKDRLDYAAKYLHGASLAAADVASLDDLLQGLNHAR